MRSSNFSHNGQLLAALVCLAHFAAADSQYSRDHWGPEKGFPSGPVYAITQTGDGYLWIGTEAGLVRFDGLAFTLIRSARPAVSSLEQPLSQALGVTADNAGGLWIRLRGLNLLHYSAGVFEDPPPDLQKMEGGVTASIRSNGAQIFATQRKGILALRGGKLETLATAQATPVSPVISLAQTADGDIWLGTRDDGLVRLRAGQATPIKNGLPNLKINCLQWAGNTLWIGTDRGVVRWGGSAISKAGVPPSLEHAQTLAMTSSRDGTLFVGTAANGLISIDRQGLATLLEPSGQPITAVFEDRESNLWIAGDSRLQRLRHGVFSTYSKQDGLPADNNGAVYADAEDRVWFAPATGGLYSMQHGKVEPVREAGLEKDIVYSIAGRGADLWIGRQHGGLTHLRANEAPKTYTRTDGLAQDSVFAVNVNRDESVWAGTLNGGVSHFADNHFTNYTSANGLASDTIYSILEGADGTMWFATPAGLSSFSKSHWRTYGTTEGLPSENVNTLFEDSAGTLWAGTINGLAFLRAGRMIVPAAIQPSLHEPVVGIAEEPNTKDGALWIATSTHVARIVRQKLLTGPLSDEDLRLYDLADGLHSTSGIRRHRSVASDAHGKIWISTTGGLSLVDTASPRGGSIPAIVHIQALTADGTAIPLQAPIRIPGGNQRITVDYAGLSLGIPERVRFRYMLENFDRGWSAPVANREAVYTNLPPGQYRFRVIASNLDGAFNSTEAALNFKIEPLFWQNWWFRLSTLLLFGAAVAAYIRFRMGRIRDTMNLRFEERLAERTRIAQELHDTLLQGFLSASMQLHVAADRLPEDSPAKPGLTHVLDLMRRVIEESRRTLQGLRSAAPADQSDLEHAFSSIQQELNPGKDVSFRIVVEGKIRPLHPILRDEVYRIGREALVNAFRHSQATSVEVELEFAPKRLRVLIRDNGRGIDPLVLEAGREGHWGLPGMRERAERIGATLRLWSRAASGTEVELSVPGHVAFKKK